MQVSVEELEGLERRMTVQVPAQDIEREVSSRLHSLSRKAKLHGFRPGKIPLKVVQRMYGRQVRQEVVGEVLKSSFKDALSQQQLHLAAEPNIEPKETEAGDDLEYSVTFEVFPQFEVAGIEGLKVELPVAAVGESDIDGMVENLRKQRTIWNDVERTATEGDQVVTTFEGKIDGESFPGSKGDKVPVIIGRNQVPKMLEEALLGLKAGDEKQFRMAFADDHSDEKLAGKTAHFSVKVESVAEPELPPVNEEFAASFGVKEGGVESLRRALRQNMERELNAAVKNHTKQQLLEALLRANDIPVPRVMINHEVDEMAQKAGLLVDVEKDSEETVKSRRELFQQPARRRVALGMILSKLAADNNIEVDDPRVQAQLANIASTFEDSERIIRHYQEKPHLMEDVRAIALEEQIVDWLMERAEVIDRPSSFGEMMIGASAIGHVAAEER